MLRTLAAGAVLALGLALPAASAERAIIVLDGSGSMWAQIDGKARITIARETLASVLATLPPDLELGFMTYGHREKGNCGDIEMLVEPAAGTGAAISAAADAINPKGMTPISDAVRLAAEDLRYTEEKATVILITDGLETCEVDPCALASDLESQGIDFTTHVLGFGLSDEEGQQVACLAENTGGKYLPAGDGAALVEALTATVAEVAQAEPVQPPEPEPEPEPVVADYNLAPTASLAEGSPDLTDDGHEDLTWVWHKANADGSEGPYIGTDYYAGFHGTLEPGQYILTASVGNASVSQPVSIEAGKVAAPHFVLDAVVLKVHPRPSEGAAVDEDATVEMRHGADYITTEYGDVDTTVPAGELTLIVTIGEATVTETFSAKAGETVEKDIVLGVGTANLSAAYIEGMPVEADVFIEVLEAKKAIDGSRKSVSYGYGGEQSFQLPAGDYVATYDLGGAKGEVPFSVKTAEAVDVALVMDAGVLAVTVPGDAYVEIISAKADIAGNRESFDYGYGPDFQTTLKAGDYLIRSLDQDMPVTITGGERSEVTVLPAAAASPAPADKKK